MEATSYFLEPSRRSGPVHPLVYSHPDTGRPVMCLHLGMTEGFILNYGGEGERFTTPAETRTILMQIHQEIVKDGGAWQYHHKWQQGDLVVTDNLAVGHEADPDTQLTREQVGLRVMHRVTIAGKKKPEK